MLLVLWLTGRPAAAEDMLVLQGRQAEMVWAPAGGALVQFARGSEAGMPHDFAGRGRGKIAEERRSGQGRRSLFQKRPPISSKRLIHGQAEREKYPRQDSNL